MRLAFNGTGAWIYGSMSNNHGAYSGKFSKYNYTHSEDRYLTRQHASTAGRMGRIWAMPTIGR
jgi:hypothetical protein